MKQLFNEYQALNPIGYEIARNFGKALRKFTDSLESDLDLIQLEHIINSEVSVHLASMRITKALEKRNDPTV